MIQQTGRPIIYSLSPGVRATPDIAMKVKNISNMYRVTADDWDTWSDLLTHFDVARSAIQSLVLFKYQPIQAASSVVRAFRNCLLKNYNLMFNILS